MLKTVSPISPVVLGAAMALFVWLMPNYSPPSSMGVLIGPGVAMGVAALYLVIQLHPIFRRRLASVWYFALEIELSHVPMYVLVALGTLLVTGNVTMSSFQLVIMAVLFAVVQGDVVGVTAVMTQRYFLTDETALVRPAR